MISLLEKLQESKPEIIKEAPIFPKLNQEQKDALKTIALTAKVFDGTIESKDLDIVSNLLETIIVMKDQKEEPNKIINIVETKLNDYYEAISL